MNNAQLIQQLSREDQIEFLSILHVQRELYIEQNGTDYTFSVGVALTTEKKHNNFKVWTIKNTDVFTREYLDAFHNTLPDMNW